jgi:hypothetical protein
MSKSKKITDHEDALDLYFNEMLVHSTANIVSGKTTVRLDKAKLASEYDLTKPFQALLFDINGLQLAIRSKYIKAILPWPETPLKQSQETLNNKAKRH